MMTLSSGQAVAELLSVPGFGQRDCPTARLRPER